MLFTDRRVLVVNPTYKPRWELPGGAVEEDESPGTAAVREIAEELGIERTVGRLLTVDHVPADPSRARTERARLDVLVPASRAKSGRVLR